MIYVRLPSIIVCLCLGAVLVLELTHFSGQGRADTPQANTGILLRLAEQERAVKALTELVETQKRQLEALTVLVENKKNELEVVTTWVAKHFNAAGNTLQVKSELMPLRDVRTPGGVLKIFDNDSENAFVIHIFGDVQLKHSSDRADKLRILSSKVSTRLE